MLCVNTHRGFYLIFLSRMIKPFKVFGTDSTVGKQTLQCPANRRVWFSGVLPAADSDSGILAISVAVYEIRKWVWFLTVRLNISNVFCPKNYFAEYNLLQNGLKMKWICFLHQRAAKQCITAAFILVTVHQRYFSISRRNGFKHLKKFNIIL